MANTDHRKNIINELSQKLGANPDELETSAKEGNIENILRKLSPAQQTKVRSLLNNPEEARKVLENPQVQALLRKLQGNG